MIALVLLLLCFMVPRAWAAADLGTFAYDQRPGQLVPIHTAFSDSKGRTLTLQQAIEGRPTILALGYFHCPNLCGLVRADLMNALARLGSGRAYSLVVISIDPKETTADAASAKAVDVAQFGSAQKAERWEYLTGSAVAIRAVAEAVGFKSRFDDDARQFLHPAGLVFLTGSGTISGYLLGLGYKPGDVELGLARAANGATARALPVLLLCFHYDPKTGRYTLAIERLVQLGCGITVLVVGGTIFLALRRERRTR